MQHNTVFNLRCKTNNSGSADAWGRHIKSQWKIVPREGNGTEDHLLDAQQQRNIYLYFVSIRTSVYSVVFETKDGLGYWCYWHPVFPSSH